MWYHVWIIAACTVYAAGNTRHVTLHVGEALDISIETWYLGGKAFTCFLETPIGVIYQIQPDSEVKPPKYEVLPSSFGCTVGVKITDAEDNGQWRLFYRTEDGEENDEIYIVTVEGITDDGEDINENDELSPDNDDGAKVEYLEKQIFHTQIGAVHRIVMRKYDFGQTEACFVVTSNNKEYTFGKDQDAPGINWIQNEDVACGIEITVEGEDMIGIWTLYSREIRFSELVEKRLPFSIDVEELVQATPEEVTIAVGNDLHVRLVNAPSSDLRQTCTLVGPNRGLNSFFKKDDNNVETCGFIISDIQDKDSGTWHIIYGTKIIYKAPFEVIVTGFEDDFYPNFKWISGEPVNVSMGPENTIYCRARDPSGRVVSEQFGPCHIQLDRATKHHNGQWLITVGIPGRVTTDDHWIHVTVLDKEPIVGVYTLVQQLRPELVVGCELLSHRNIRTCKFRDPAGRTLLASEGVGEDHYSSFHSLNTSYSIENGVCWIHVRHTTIQEIGLWRCAVESDDGNVYYGFFRVSCPDFLQNECFYSSFVTEPTLTAYEDSIWAPEGEITMSCSIQAEINYCYFRSSNGSVFSVNSGMRTDRMVYVGNGFQAGECGVRMSLQTQDSGTWSCHVGYKRNTTEQRTAISVSIQPQFTATQSRIGPSVMLNAHVFEGRSLEYCRYVRIDGFGFTEENVPPQYTSFSDLHHGVCTLSIPHPTMLDHHPWTVAVRVNGMSAEYTATTSPTMVMPPPPPPPTRSFFARFWVLVILVCVTGSFLAMMLSTRKSRNWTSMKAASIRNSFKRKNNAATNNNNTNNNTTNNANPSPPAYTV